MDASELEHLRKQAVKAIVPRLPALERADLVTLLATEENEANPRESLIKALVDEIAARDADDADVDAAAHADDAPPAWQADDYLGPLTADQAHWRNAHVTPRRLAEQLTKPAGEVLDK